jgi:cytochrome c oxidase subunit 2
MYEFIFNKTLCDSPEPWQMSFQEAATPTMEGIINLHNDIMAIIVFILVFVCWMLGRTLYLFSSSRNKTPSKTVHGMVIELVWTILPSFILISISIPSFALLYSMDEVIDPAITLKVVGHQWYWSYEYSDYSTSDDETINFDSYIIQEDDLELGQLRLLEVDNRVVLPINTHVRVLITSTDVIHAWAIPSLGIKCDAYPGRLNQVSTFIKREGIFHGQCSELCGVNHGFMPIVVEAVTLQDYVSWISTKLEDA